MLTSLLNKVVARQGLTQAEAAALLDALLAEEATDARIAAALIALAVKGETEEELAGFAETMRARCARIAPTHSIFVDTCGTGGSSAKTFNVSTAAAFIVAAAGVPVAKHGNVGVTSKSGSADVLRALGVRVDLEPQRVGRIFDQLGICFMFAPLHHPATRRVAAVRRDLGVRTIFNLLGPLTNPAGAPFQVIGVSNPAACEKVALALSRLGTRRSWVVHGEDGLDEVTLAGSTNVYEALPNGIKQFKISPGDFGLSRAGMQGLNGGTAEENAEIIRAVLTGQRQDAARDLVLMNAATSLHVAGACVTLREGIELAAQAIAEHSASAKLEALRDLSQSREV
ncbi:MAG TPA: anthranilate phosphoribosyltransferase [Blastocatellia bacterium]|nr:anthranilate phosphoribosyltransferase [Blastocatellia bacterium]